MTTTDQRNAYIEGLRVIADALDADPDLPLPYHGGLVHELIFCATKEQMVAWSRVLTGKADKHVDDGSDRYGFELHGQVHGFKTKVLVDRAEVCQRIVTGTREVTKDVLDPDALATVPTVTVTETVEDVEWVCTPLLAESGAA